MRFDKLSERHLRRLLRKGQPFRKPAGALRQAQRTSPPTPLRKGQPFSCPEPVEGQQLSERHLRRPCRRVSRSRALSLSKGNSSANVTSDALLRKGQPFSCPEPVEGQQQQQLAGALRQAQRTSPPTPLRKGQPFSCPEPVEGQQLSERHLRRPLPKGQPFSCPEPVEGQQLSERHLRRPSAEGSAVSCPEPVEGQQQHETDRCASTSSANVTSDAFCGRVSRFVNRRVRFDKLSERHLRRLCRRVSRSRALSLSKGKGSANVTSERRDGDATRHPAPVRLRCRFRWSRHLPRSERARERRCHVLSAQVVRSGPWHRGRARRRKGSGSENESRRQLAYGACAGPAMADYSTVAATAPGRLGPGCANRPHVQECSSARDRDQRAVLR